MNIVSQFIHRYSRNKTLGTLLFFYFLWVLSLVFRSIHGLDDFDVFFHAGKRLLMGEDIYAPPYYNFLKFYYSPLFALLLSPFTGLPVAYVKISWFFLNYVLLIRSVFIISRYTKWNFRGSAWVLLCLCLCSGKIIMHNFLANQVTILILWTLLESFRLYTSQRPFWSILVFCLGLNFKVMSLLVLPFYFLVGRIKHKLLFPLITVLLLFIPLLGVSWRYNLFLLRQWWEGINPMDRFHVLQTSEQGFLDLGSLITRYFTSGEIIHEPLINMMDLGYLPVFILTNFMRLALLLITIWTVRRVKCHLPGVNLDLARIVPFIALVPLILPHQRDYSFLLVMPMLVILLLLLVRMRQKNLYVFCAVFICLSGMLAWSSLIGRGLVDIFYYYRLITLGMLALLCFYLHILTKAGRNILTSAKDVQKSQA